MMRIYNLEELLLPTDHATSDRREWASGNNITVHTLNYDAAWLHCKTEIWLKMCVNVEYIKLKNELHLGDKIKWEIKESKIFLMF